MNVFPTRVSIDCKRYYNIRGVESNPNLLSCNASNKKKLTAIYSSNLVSILVVLLKPVVFLLPQIPPKHFKLLSFQIVWL